MSNPHFKIAIDAPRKLVSMAISDLFNLSDVRDFFAAERAAVSRIGCAFGDHMVLIDVSGITPQQQDVVQEFQRTLSSMPIAAKKTAVVTQSTLTRLQTKRVIQIHGNAGIFEDMDEAQAWLSS